LLITGPSGSGKSTFINTLCESPVLPKRDYGNAERAASAKSVAIAPSTVGRFLRKLEYCRN
jgi:cell division control protein 11